MKDHASREGFTPSVFHLMKSPIISLWSKAIRVGMLSGMKNAALAASSPPNGVPSALQWKTALTVSPLGSLQGRE